MNKIKQFAFFAIILVAATFIFNCSSDSNDGGGDGSIANLPSNSSNNQTYLDGSEYKGDGDIKIVLRNVNDKSIRDTFPAGKIKGGKITWNLPENIDSKYLPPTYSKCQDEDYYCEKDFWPAVSILEPSLKAEIPSKGLCTLNDEPHVVNSSGQQIGKTELLYFSVSGTIKGTLIALYDGGERVYDASFSKGWNLMYIYGNTLSDNPNIISGIANSYLMLTLSCN